jgi:hypothetical protein
MMAGAEHGGDELGGGGMRECKDCEEFYMALRTGDGKIDVEY